MTVLHAAYSMTADNKLVPCFILFGGHTLAYLAKLCLELELQTIPLHADHLRGHGPSQGSIRGHGPSQGSWSNSGVHLRGDGSTQGSISGVHQGSISGVMVQFRGHQGSVSRVHLMGHCPSQGSS
jgi:hypothetical protein